MKTAVERPTLIWMSACLLVGLGNVSDSAAASIGILGQSDELMKPLLVDEGEDEARGSSDASKDNRPSDKAAAEPDGDGSSDEGGEQSADTNDPSADQESASGDDEDGDAPSGSAASGESAANINGGDLTGASAQPVGTATAADISSASGGASQQTGATADLSALSFAGEGDPQDLDFVAPSSAVPGFVEDLAPKNDVASGCPGDASQNGCVSGTATQSRSAGAPVQSGGVDRPPMLSAASTPTVARPPVGVSRPGLEISLVNPVRRTNDLVVQGFIFNTSNQVQSVPPMLISLRSRADQDLQRMIMRPPIGSLAPGQHTKFKSVVRPLPDGVARVNAVFIAASS